jgi:hypothetical protein
VSAEPSRGHGLTGPTLLAAACCFFALLLLEVLAGRIVAATEPGIQTGTVLYVAVLALGPVAGGLVGALVAARRGGVRSGLMAGTLGAGGLVVVLSAGAVVLYGGLVRGFLTAVAGVALAAVGARIGAGREHAW